jgi:hypothetical protein
MTDRDLLIRSAIQPDGGLDDLGWYLCWTPGDEKAVLDGWFTAEELRAIADHMDKQNAVHGEGVKT